MMISTWFHTSSASHLSECSSKIKNRFMRSHADLSWSDSKTRSQQVLHFYIGKKATYPSLTTDMTSPSGDLSIFSMNSSESIPTRKA
jgi:hypothetical protein